VESTSQPPAGYAGELLGLVLYFQNEAAASSARVLEPKSEGTGCGERPGYCFDLHPRVLLLLLLCVCEAGGAFPFFSHARPPREALVSSGKKNCAFRRHSDNSNSNSLLFTPNLIAGIKQQLNRS
jgi:hypothetical protein